MKKLTLFTTLFMLCSVVFAGGLLTNTNQSAQFIRMMSRNASYEIDAVYYNPAGIIKLEDGWHFAFYSQTIFQERNVESKFPLLNDGKYVGEVTVPVFPTAFAVYKMENWAFSLGFGPNGGGGTAEFERGLPSFEIPLTKLGAGLKTLSPLMSVNQLPTVNGYDAELSFKGTSIFWGIQLGASYKINDKFSVFAGVRYLPSKNNYMGEINNIMVATSAGEMTASNYLQLVDPVLVGTINTLNVSTSGLQAGIDAGLLKPNDPLTNPQILQIMGLLGVSGVTNQQAIGIMNKTKTDIQTLQNADVADKKVDTEQTGAGFTPMIGVNISPNEDWNIGIKYEHKTYMTLTNNTKVDDMKLFPDKAKVASDVPGILGIGIGYKGLKWLEAQFSYTQFFNKRVGWGGNTRDMAVWKSVDPAQIRRREIENNGYEAGLGFQFNLSDNFAVSAGGLYGDLGVADSYQSDFSYSNPSTTIGAGIMWKISDHLKMDAGVSNTFYKDQTVTFADPDVPNYNDVYGKTALTFAAGLSYSIF